MKVFECEIKGLFLIKGDIFPDKRGFFCESYSKRKYCELGINNEFVQDNVSRSSKNVIRGLHYQISPCAQTKLISVIEGEIFDVAVDIRKNSPSFGRWFGVSLEGPFKTQFLIPAGFAHGFCVLSETATILYKCDASYSPEHERGLIWNDPELEIAWPVLNPIVSEKDMKFPSIKDQKDIFFTL
jgi:dTDP-4-dehydrorhamnose 3,5-epimerase